MLFLLFIVNLGLLIHKDALFIHVRYIVNLYRILKNIFVFVKILLTKINTNCYFIALPNVNTFSLIVPVLIIFYFTCNDTIED